MALRRSCHPTQPAPPPAARAAAQLSALPVAQQCTQMPRNGVERPFSAICVHYCVPTRPLARASHRNSRRNSVHKWPRTAPRGRFRRSVYTIASPCVPTGRPRNPRAAALGATVYTNGPERRRKTVFANLCTLLRHHRTPARPPRRNSVHKCPGTAPKGRFRRSVYTIASPPAARVLLASQLSPQQCTQMPQNGSERPFSAICVHYCVTTGRPRGPRVATVYTNGPERRRKVVFGDLCTLLCPPASPPAARAGLAAQQCTQSRSP